jgi:hypothetical protein
MAVAKHIVSQLLSASWRDWRKLPRTKDKYRSAVVAEDLIRRDYRRWSRKQAATTTKKGVSDTWKSEIGGIKGQNSYSTGDVGRMGNPKDLDLSKIDTSHYQTTQQCVQDLMDNHGADRDTAVNACISFGLERKNNSGNNSNGQTKSASVKQTPDFVKIHNSLFPEQWGDTTYYPPSTKVRLRNAAVVDNRPAWFRTMKHLEKKMGTNTDNIGTGRAVGDGDDGSRLRNASSSSSSAKIPASMRVLSRSTSIGI